MGGEFEHEADVSTVGGYDLEVDLAESVHSLGSVATDATFVGEDAADQQGHHHHQQRQQRQQRGGGAAHRPGGRNTASRQERRAASRQHKKKLKELESVMKRSSHGKLESYLAHVGLDVNTLGLPLPRIIFVGDESTGKSATLARVIGCDVIPSAEGLTTRCPIVLRLKNVSDMPAHQRTILLETRESGQSYMRDVSGAEDVAALVLDEMDKICGHDNGEDEEDEAEGVSVSTDELVVEIHSSSVPNLELVDLPGVVAFPEPTRRETEGLVRGYAQDPHCLIICVADAAQSSIRNCRTLGLLGELGVCDRTIVASTKWDNVPANSLEYKCNAVFRECEDLRVADVVAVVNRHHSESFISIEDELRREDQWFGLYLPQLNEADVGVGALLLAIDRRLHDVIVGRWLPAAMHLVSAKLDEIRTATQALGPAPASYQSDVTPLMEQVAQCLPVLLSAIQQECEAFLMREARDHGLPANAAFSALNLQHVRARQHERDALQARLVALVGRVMDLSMQHLNAVLADQEPGVQDTHHLARFPNLAQAVRQAFRSHLNATAAEAEQQADAHLHMHWALVTGQPYGPDFDRRVAHALVEVVSTHLALPLEDLMTPGGADGEEEDEEEGSIIGGGGVSELQKLVQRPPSNDDDDQQQQQQQQQQAMASSEWVAALLREEPETAARREQLSLDFDRHTETLEMLDGMSRTGYGQEFEA